MRFAAILNIQLANAGGNSTQPEFAEIWNFVTLALFSNNFLFCGLNVIVVSYLTFVSRRAYLPFLQFCTFCVLANILSFPHIIFMTFYLYDIDVAGFYAIYTAGYFADVCYSAASYQLLYIYLERFLRMHYPFRFRLRPTACQQVLASCASVVVAACSSVSILFYIAKNSAHDKEYTKIVMEDQQFSEKYPVYGYLVVMDAVVSVIVPAVGIIVLAKINTSKLAAITLFNQSSGCWNARFGKVMSLEAWIHKEVRLCTAMAMLHIFLFLPDAILGITYNTNRRNLSSSKAYQIAGIVVRVVQLLSMAAHTAVFLAFCPAYRAAVVKAYRAWQAAVAKVGPTRVELKRTGPKADIVVSKF